MGAWKMGKYGNWSDKRDVFIVGGEVFFQDRNHPGDKKETIPVSAFTLYPIHKTLNSDQGFRHEEYTHINYRFRSEAWFGSSYNGWLCFESGTDNRVKFYHALKERKKELAKPKRKVSQT